MIKTIFLCRVGTKKTKRCKENKSTITSQIIYQNTNNSQIVDTNELSVTCIIQLGQYDV